MIAIQQAQEAHARAVDHHNKLVAERDSRHGNLQKVEAMKADHDAKRAAALKSHVPGTATTAL